MSRRGQLPHRLGKEGGDLSPGAPAHSMVRNRERSGAKHDPHHFSRYRLRRVPESIFVHASEVSPTHPHPVAQEEHEDIQFARRRQKTEGFASLYFRPALKGRSHKE